MITMTGYDRAFEVPRSLRHAAAGCDVNHPVIRRLAMGRVTAWDMLSPVLAGVPGADRWTEKSLNSMLAAIGARGTEACRECEDTGFYGLPDSADDDRLVRLFRRTGDDAYETLLSDGTWHEWVFDREKPFPALEVLSLDIAQDLADAVLAGAGGLVRRFYWPLAFLPPTGLLAATPGLEKAAPAADDEGTVFAVVDELDTGAILALIRLKPGPELEKYDKGQWTPDNDLLVQLQGVKPPPLVELTPDQVTDVLGQIDAGGPDGKDKGKTAAGLVADAPLTVSPDPRAEKLRRYWASGEGAAKIRWGTPGDWKRCYRHLSKFMGTRAKGYCNNLHRRVTGVWTGDKANVGSGLSASGHVLRVGDRFEMRGPDAIPYIAEVVDLFAVRNRADPQLVGDSVDVIHASGFNSDDRVAVSVVRVVGDPATVFNDRQVGAKSVLKGWATGPDDLLPAEGIAILLPPSVVSTAHLATHKRSVAGFYKAHAQTVALMSTEEALVAAIQAQTWSGENGRTTMAGIKDGIYEETVEDSFQGIIRGLTAGAFPVKPPDEWFDDPRLSTETPLVVEDSGQVYGHLASFQMPHIGLPGKVRAPKSYSNYAYFKTGVVPTEKGNRVPVGQLTLAGGHAPLHADAGSAVAHYDNTNSAVADVNVGEDRYGIWFAGALRPEVTPEQVRAFMASALSGDWRPINGHLELVACCSVNVPGFPIARALAAGGAIVAMVAAGARPLAVKAASMRADAAVVERLAALETAVYEPAEVVDGVVDEAGDGVLTMTPAAEPEEEQEQDAEVDEKVARARAMVAERKERRRQELRDRVHGVAAGGAAPKA